MPIAPTFAAGMTLGASAGTAAAAGSQTDSATSTFQSLLQEQAQKGGAASSSASASDTAASGTSDSAAPSAAQDASTSPTSANPSANTPASASSPSNGGASGSTTSASSNGGAPAVAHGVGTDTGAKPATSSKSSKTNLSKGHDTDSANPLVPNTTASASTSLTAQAQASAMGAQSVQQAASDPDKAADTGPESSGAQTQAVGGASTPAAGPGGWKVGSNPVLSEGDDNENPGDASGPDASSGTAALSSTASGAIASALADAHASPAALADPGSKLVHAAFSASIGAESAQTLAAGAGQSNSVSTSTLPSTTASASVAAPVSSDQFGSEAATKILYFVQNGVQSAQLSLNPAHLGPMDVQIRVNGDQVNLALSAAQPETRHALEMSLPKLREMFSEQGIQLGDLSVGARGFANSGGQQQYAASQRLAGGSTKAPDAGAIAGDSPVTVRSLQLVDTFA